MIEVGLDVDRLGLMTVVGMPKNFSQYIQVTGRVGRRTTSPAIILVVHNRGNRRDQSYFESFIQNHDRLYAAVEATSVTPMAGKGGAALALHRVDHAHPLAWRRPAGLCQGTGRGKGRVCETADIGPGSRRP